MYKCIQWNAHASNFNTKAARQHQRVFYNVFQYNIIVARLTSTAVVVPSGHLLVPSWPPPNGDQQPFDHVE